MNYDIDAYVQTLDQILRKKKMLVSDILEKLTLFRSHLSHEEASAKKLSKQRKHHSKKKKSSSTASQATSGDAEQSSTAK